MALKLLSLNIENHQHLPLVTALLEQEKPEVICLQEIQEPDFEMFKKRFGFTGFFVPMITHRRNKEIAKEKLVRQGIAFYATLPLLKCEYFFYSGKGNSPSYTEPNSFDRALVLGVVEKEGKKYNITTTHFTWADDGGVNEEQRQDLKRLLQLLQQQGELVLCGDFNAPRGREIFTMLNSHLKDNIPAEIKTTLDQNLHRAGPLPYVVDYLWSTPTYLVRNVKVISGVSDHMAVLGEIEKRE